jgi:hypothetical protein
LRPRTPYQNPFQEPQLRRRQVGSAIAFFKPESSFRHPQYHILSSESGLSTSVEDTSQQRHASTASIQAPVFAEMAPDSHPADRVSLFERSQQQPPSEGSSTNDSGEKTANPLGLSFEIDMALFPFILNFLGATNLQLESPQTHYQEEDTPIFRSRQICTWVAQLLERTSSPDDITAATMRFQKKHIWQFMYTKNRKTLSTNDIASQEALEAVLKTADTVEPMPFLEKILYHTSKHCPKRYQGKCKEILELGPTVARHIQTMILQTPNSFSMAIRSIRRIIKTKPCNPWQRISKRVPWK